MKLADLFEQQQIKKHDVDVPSVTTELDYGDFVVNGNFNCGFSKIKSLKGSPGAVSGDYSCMCTKIKTLKGISDQIGGNLECSHTDITSFEGGPSYVGRSVVSSDTRIGIVTACPGNPNIISLQNIHKHIKHIGEGLYLPNTVKSHILGVMLIKGLKVIMFINGTEQQQKVEKLINKHLAGNRNVHEAHEELIDAGLEEFAQI